MEIIMREIKFRGYSKKLGRWVYGDLVHSCLTAYNLIAEVGIAEHGCYAVEVDPKSVGQFTGLTDKNGKDICEGDIVNHHETKGYDCLSVGAIIYDDWKAQYRHSSYSEEYLTGNCLEVIGNIYENPELLEANDD